MHVLRHDVAIVGAGIVGTDVAREPSQYDLKTILIEAGPVGTKCLYSGGPCRNRTCDHLIKSQMLYQLS